MYLETNVFWGLHINLYVYTIIDQGKTYNNRYSKEKAYSAIVNLLYIPQHNTYRKKNYTTDISRTPDKRTLPNHNYTYTLYLCYQS